MSTPSTTGGCLCGAVRFELTRARRKRAGYCHCTRCQRRPARPPRRRRGSTGATFRLTGRARTLTRLAPSGRRLRECFCAVCGSHLFSRNPDDAPQMSIRMAAFDGDPGRAAELARLRRLRGAWEPIPDDGLERHPEARPH